MWLFLVIPLFLLFVCFRLILRSRKRTTPSSFSIPELASEEVAAAARHQLEEHQFSPAPQVLPQTQATHETAATSSAKAVPHPVRTSFRSSDPAHDAPDYQYPPLNLLDNMDDAPIMDEPDLEAAKTRMIEVLKSHNIGVQSVSVSVSAAVTTYEVVPSPGVRVSRFKHLEANLTGSFPPPMVRVVGPIPGRGAIGIEIPNTERRAVNLRSILSSEAFQKCTFDLPVALGKTTNNDFFVVDLATSPNLLIAGSTGQGKSIGLHSIIASLLFKKSPAQVKFVLIDPKGNEMNLYKTIERPFLAAVSGSEVIISDVRKFVEALTALCIEMDNRYSILQEASARNVKDYNGKIKRRLLDHSKGHLYLPYIVIVIEDFSDMLKLAGADLKKSVTRLAGRGPTVGLHVVIATSQYDAGVLSPELKDCFPSRAAFKVTTSGESRAILGEPGAERLLGQGDLLFKYDNTTTRIQGAFTNTPELERITEFIGHQRGYPHPYPLPEFIDENELAGKDFDLAELDPLFAEAARLIVVNQLGSTSLIQRKLKLGYNRTGRIMDQLEAAGVVGPGMGSKPRDVLIQTEMELDQLLRP